MINLSSYLFNLRVKKANSRLIARFCLFLGLIGLLGLGKPGEEKSPRVIIAPGTRGDETKTSAGRQAYWLEKIKKNLKNAEQGDKDAQFFWGNVYLDGLGLKKDPQQAYLWYRKAAEQGDRRAQIALGNMYRDGLGVKKDPQQACQWYRKAVGDIDRYTGIYLGEPQDGQEIKKNPEQACKLYRKIAEKIYSEDQCLFAEDLFKAGYYEEALKWYHRAAEQDHLSAQIDLGYIYMDGKGVKKNAREAAKWLEKTDEGNPEKLFQMATMLEYGQGGIKDYKEAAKWYHKAALAAKEADDQDMLVVIGYSLGSMYEKGRGVKKDYAEAIKWYREPVWDGYKFGAYYPGNYKAELESLRLLGAKAPKGSAESQFAKALNKSQDKDYLEAVKWYTKAAEQGYLPAQTKLALMYLDGKVVKRDPVEALKWYRKAAEQGDMGAQTLLGTCYSSCQDVYIPPDNLEAVKWLRKAAEQGAEYAQFRLGIMYERGLGVKKDIQEAMKLYYLAAEKGEKGALRRLAFLYEKGKEVKQDYQQAAKLYRAVAERSIIIKKRLNEIEAMQSQP